MIVSRHIRPDSVSDAHVLSRLDNGEVELVMEPADRIGFEGDDMVHIPFDSGHVGSLHGQRVCLGFNQFKQIAVKRKSGGNLHGSPARAVNASLEAHAICPESLSDSTLASAGYRFPAGYLVPREYRQPSARARTKPAHVASHRARCGCPHHNHEVSEFSASEIGESIRRSRCSRFGQEASAGPGISVHQGHPYYGRELSAVAGAVPLAHRDLSVSFRSVPGQHLEASESHSGLHFGCAFDAQASAGLAISASEVPDIDNGFAAAITSAYPAPGFPAFSAVFSMKCGQLTKSMSCDVDCFCHDGLGGA